MKTMTQHLAKDYDIDDGVYFSKEVLVGDRGAEMSALQARQMVRDALDDGELRQGFLRDRISCRCPGLSPRHHSGRPRQGDLPPRACQQRVGALGRPRRDGVVRDRGRQQEPGYRQRAAVAPHRPPDQEIPRSREGWKGQILSGFGITKLVTECFRGDASREDKALYDTMKAIRDRLKGNLVVQHPVTPGETITSGNDEARARFLRDPLSEALDTLVLHGREEARAKAAASLLRGAAAPGCGRVHLPERTAARRQATGIRRMWWVRQEVAAVDALWEQEAWLTAARPRPSSRA
jgi:hypothetical protein